MAYRLTESQEKIIQLVTAALNQKATPQLRFFWRKLRAAALPAIPTPKRTASPIANALEQTRWQRLAALAAESHVAAAGLLQAEIKLIRELRDEAPTEKAVSASQAGAALVDAVIDAPRAVQWEIYQRLSELPGFADGDDEDEDDDEPEERPPLRAVRGGKK